METAKSGSRGAKKTSGDGAEDEAEGQFNLQEAARTWERAVAEEGVAHSTRGYNEAATAVRQLMHGFGDREVVRADTADLVLDMVVGFMQGLAREAAGEADAAARRGVTVDDFFWVLRNDRAKYLRAKDKVASAKAFRAAMPSRGDRAQAEETSAGLNLQ